MRRPCLDPQLDISVNSTKLQVSLLHPNTTPVPTLRLALCVGRSSTAKATATLPPLDLAVISVGTAFTAVVCDASKVCIIIIACGRGGGLETSIRGL